MRINTRLRAFRCIRCHSEHPISDYPEGCPSCLTARTPSSVAPIFEHLPALASQQSGMGMTRFAARLAYEDFQSLGEGDTPFIALPSIARELGIESLHAKFEGANPTGSHKDRMSALFVARARARSVAGVVAASSGNAGASLAAYAAASGLDCTIVTTANMNPNWRHAIEATGAKLVFATDVFERWQIVRRMVEEQNYASATNYLDPPVGSDAYGVDAYKTLGYELADHVAQGQADTILVPTARGDLLWGICTGLAEAVSEGIISSMPRIVAVEPFARLEHVLAGGDVHAHYPGSSLLSSINGATATYQSLSALRSVGGTAVSVPSERVVADRNRMAAAGLYLELSAAAPLTALKVLLEARATPVRRAILVATSHGYKELA